MKSAAILLFWIALLFCPIILGAQAVAGDVSLSAGIGSMYRLQRLIQTDSDPTGFYASNYSRKGTRGGGPFFLSFHASLGKRFMLGGGFGIEWEEGNYGEPAGPVLGEYRQQSFTAAFEVRYAWMMEWSQWRLYSKAGFGPSMINSYSGYYSTYNGQTVVSESAEVRFIGGIAYQVSPFGIEWGRTIAGFAELGYGYKGILHAGIACRFH